MSASPSSHSVRGSASLFATAAYIAKISLGAGLLGLPFAVQQSGLALGLTAITTACALNALSVHVLTACRTMAALGASEDAFAELARVTLGPRGPALVHASIIMTLLGAVSVYSLAITELATSLLPVSRLVAALVLVTVIAPVSLVRDLSFLSFASVLGTASYIVSFTLIFVDGWQSSRFSLPDDYMSPVSWLSVVSVFGVTSFSLGFPVLAFALQDSMQQPHKLTAVTSLTMMVVAIAYSAIAVLGVGLFDTVAPNILANMRPHSWDSRAAKLSVLVTLLLTLPLSLAPALNTIQQRFLTPNKHEQSEEQTLLQNNMHSREYYGGMEDSQHERVVTEAPITQRELRGHGVSVLRMLCLCLCVLVAFLVPNFTLLMSIIGLVTLSLLCFILPPVMYLILTQSHRQLGDRRMRVVCQLFLALGLLLALSGAVQLVLGRSS